MPDTMLSKIASEALKPMSSVIDALLGPKLQRIRNWSEKQDLSSRLGSGKIDVLLDQYIRQLLRRICGVTTIVFPQRSLPLTSIYEPLVLRERYARRDSKNTTPFSVGELKQGLNYFVVDSAGMGKSTFAKHLVLEILNSTTKIPMFLELRRIGENESLVGKLASEIDETGKDINERLLRLLFDESDFMLILDGFDEVAEQARKGLGEQITQLAVQCEKLQVMVTARPEVSLPELPNSKALTIDSLTKAQAESLVLRYDEVAKIDVGKRLVAQFDAVSEQFLATPLLVVLLYRTYGFNHTIATKITSFYDEIYNALYKGHDLSKAGFAREKSSRLDPEDFRRLLRGFSFLLAARQKDNLKSETECVTIIDEAIRLTSIRPTSASAFFEDLLLAVPLLVKEGTEYRFIHKSIGEFFASEFLSYQVTPEQIIKRIREGNLNNHFVNIFQYLSEINPSIFRRFIIAPIAQEVLDMPIKNPHIRAMRFLSPAVIGVWPTDKYTMGIPKHGREQIQDIKEFNCSSWLQGKFEGRGCLLGISFQENYRVMPKAVLEAITEEVSYTDSDSEVNLDFLGNVNDFEQWIPIDDERIMRFADEQAITMALSQAMDFAINEIMDGEYFGDYEEADDEVEIYKIVSVAACEEFLRQIKQEDETRDWIEALVADEASKIHNLR